MGAKSAARQKRSRSNRGRARRGLGAPPGSLQAPPQAEATRLKILSYGPDAIETLGAWRASVKAWPVHWVRIIGLSDIELIRSLGERYGLHPLALEDALNGAQRPKVEDYDDHFFVTSRVVTEEGEGEQISMFVGEGFVLTLEAQEGSWFEPVERRLLKNRGRARRQGADYLAYTLIDALIDHITPAIDAFGVRLEGLEEAILRGEEGDLIAQLLDLRRALQGLRRLTINLRDKLAALRHPDLPVITDETRIYLRDCHDHAIRLVESVESWREFSANLVDVHLAVAGQQLNAVMKVLTMIATIFIPLSFIAGLYGMNFNPERSTLNMPELNWRWGYLYVLGLMVVTLILQVYFFWKKGWLNELKPRKRELG